MSGIGLSIGDVARRAGCSVPSIRYYEDVGLLPAAHRRAGGHRVYGSGDLKRLSFIRRCRNFGFSLAQIRELLEASQPGKPCAEARDVAAGHLRTIRAKLAELQALERTLAGFVRTCETTCAVGAVEDCTLFDDLAQSPARSCCGESKP